MLLAAATLAGAEVVDLGIAPDNREKILRRESSAGWQRQMCCSSGGVSMGDLDLIKPLLERSRDDALPVGA